MELDDFITHLDHFGADFALWPATEGLVAQDLISTSLPARREWLAARKAAALIAAPPPDVEALKQAIMARLPANQSASVTVLPTARPARPPPALWAAGLALAASLMIGVFTGTTGLLSPATASVTTSTTADDFDQFVSNALSAGESYGS